MTLLMHDELETWFESRATGTSVYHIDLVEVYDPRDSWGESPYDVDYGLHASLSVEQITLNGTKVYSVFLQDGLWDGGIEGSIELLVDRISAQAAAEKLVRDWIKDFETSNVFSGLPDLDLWRVAEGEVPSPGLTLAVVALALASGTTPADSLRMAGWTWSMKSAEAFLLSGGFRPDGQPFTSTAITLLDQARRQAFVPQVPLRASAASPYSQEKLGSLLLSDGPFSYMQTLYVSVGFPQYRATKGDRYYAGITANDLSRRDRQHYTNSGDRWLDTDLNTYCTWDVMGTDEEVKTLEAWIIHSLLNSYGSHVENSMKGTRNGTRLVTRGLAYLETESAVDKVIAALHAKGLIHLAKAPLGTPYGRDLKWDQVFH